MDMDVERSQRFLRLLAHETPVDNRQSEDLTDRLASQKDICADVQIIGKRQILVNCFDSAITRLMGIIEFYFFSCVSQAAPVRVMDSGDDLDQRGFTRSVISGESQNFARVQGQ